jgi:hypothetical protein
MEVIEEAGRFALSQAVQIVHCNILIGWALLEFREVPFTVELLCPKCKETVRIKHQPTAEDIAGATEPEWVADEESSYQQEKEEDAKHDVPSSEGQLQD